MLLSAAIALAAVWGGVALAYAIPSLPPSTAVVALLVAAYALAVPAAHMLSSPYPASPVTSTIE